jgi:hypothetical protein
MRRLRAISKHRRAKCTGKKTDGADNHDAPAHHEACHNMFPRESIEKLH